MKKHDVGDGERAEEVLAGRFALEEKVGRGGMGIVYRAFDRVTERRVALKVLRAVDDDAVRRFAREAEVLERLEHPAIVRYVAHGITDPPYLAMEWIEGESLDAVLQRSQRENRSLALPDVLVLAHRLAAALAEAHAVGIVHRDVKPSNVMLPGGQFEAAKLADFGIARAQPAESLPESELGPTRTLSLTASGVMIGTVGYMSPEQARGEATLDGRADLFALGCLLYRCMTHGEAFGGAAPVEVLSKLLLEEPARVAEVRDDVPPALDDLIARLLAKDPRDRPSSATRLLEELEPIATEVARGAPIPRAASRRRRRGFRRPWLAVVAVAALGIAAAVGAKRGAPAKGKPHEVLAAFSPSADEAAMPISKLPLPDCAPAAVAVYEEGVQKLRHGSSRRAHGLFEEAARADPTCPEVQFRLVLTGEQMYDLPRERQQLREAGSLRPRLHERDQLVLDAMVKAVGTDTPDEDETVRILEEGTRRFPRDAEILTLAAIRRMRSREDHEHTLDLLRRATFIDPEFADAWQAQAEILGALGLRDDELAALDRCIAIGPDSVDCLATHVTLLKRYGRCREAADEARRRVEVDPSPWGYFHLAVSLASAGADRATVEEVLRQRTAWLSPQDAWENDGARAALAEWFGDFDGAQKISDEIGRSISTLANEEPHSMHEELVLNLLMERGSLAEAAAAAKRFHERMQSWIKTDRYMVGATWVVPDLLAIQLQAGALTPAAWRAAADAWEQETRARANDRERWILRWGPAVGKGVDAAEAMAKRPALADQQIVGVKQEIGSLILGMELYEGRILLLAGDAASARPLLEKRARACTVIEGTFSKMQAYLLLGMANEKLGDRARACEAYRFVTDRWGTTPSVTAREATARARALGCSP